MAIYRTIGVAIGAGLASALLFAASAKGAGPALIVAYLTPLPIMIAALGFGHSTGLLAAGVAVLALAGVLGLLPAVFFAALLGFPSWWLCYLVLLRRPVVATAGQGLPAQSSSPLLWYPVGRVAAWGAVLVAGVVLATGALVTFHYGGFDHAVAAVSGRLADIVGLTTEGMTTATSTRSLVILLPVLMSASAFLMLMINLWLAGRTVERSSLLSRPWPSLPENFRLPKTAAAVFVGTGLVSILGGWLGVSGGVVAAVFGMAFMLQGLGAAHFLTRGLAARGLILFAIYFITVTVVPSLVALAVLGVMDCLLPMRQRQAVKPPLPRS